MSASKFTLYIDESGIRYPQHKGVPRKDGMDWFGWGGVLVNKADEEEIVALYKEFCKKWDITYPLHSSEIRGRRGNFQWLETAKNVEDFYADLNYLLTEIKVLGFGVVVSRPGYNKRYTEKYGNSRWELCKTTYPILLERVVRYLLSLNTDVKLKVIFEGASGNENRQVVKYAQALKNGGHPFDNSNSKKYNPISSSVYQNIISGRPEPGTKSNIFLQIADLYIYPMAKFRYDPNYLAWHELYKSNRIIDSILEPNQIYVGGVKYYCFN